MRAALEAGWRHLDLAEMYGNEREIGKLFRELGWDRPNNSASGRGAGAGGVVGGCNAAAMSGGGACGEVVTTAVAGAGTAGQPLHHVPQEVLLQ